ncbi:MAG: M20/M25/M40 family metallo-hydrolase, partial [Dehalococcoidia bacterium]
VTDPARPHIDWPAVAAEALEVLRGYLRIDTSNPPGREAPAARYLAAILEAEGIATEVIEIAPEREAVVGRIRGDGSKRPLMLASHIDVVPVRREFWSVDPFGGEVRDGRILGRGAVDMKGVGVMHLFAMILARRLALPLTRDLVFLAVPDEETGSDRGMAWLVQHRPDLFDVEFSLNEGASGLDEFGDAPSHLFEVAVTEKAMSPLRLRVVGTPGHGSKPAADNPIVTLLGAVARLAEWTRPVTYTPETRAYLARLEAAGVIDDAQDGSAIEGAVTASPDTEAAFTNTVNVTMFHAGEKNNMIPAFAEAELDCRLLAGQDPEDWRRQVVARIDDPRVEVTFIYDHEPAPAVSEWDTDLSRAIDAVLREAFEDAVVVPATSIVGTDSRFLRPLGVPSYGFIPCLLSQAERDGFHGNDEFLTVDNFNMGLEVMFEVVRRVSTAAE